MNECIVLVSGGMEKPKKDFIKHETDNTYMNYSLVGLATILKEKEYSNVKVFQGDNKYKCSVWVKLNIMLYVGENKQTIKETDEWLSKQKFKGLSVTPFILFLNGEGTKEFISELKDISKCDIPYDKLLENWYCYFDLSEELNEIKAKEACNHLTLKHMSKEDYYDLKMFGYI